MNIVPRIVVYISHCLTPTPEEIAGEKYRIAPSTCSEEWAAHSIRQQHRKNAEKWVEYFARNYNIAPVATWIQLSGYWTENMRDIGLSIDRAQVEQCGIVITCGPRMSTGMLLEVGWAKHHIDMVGLSMPEVDLAFPSAAKHLGIRQVTTP